MSSSNQSSRPSVRREIETLGVNSVIRKSVTGTPQIDNVSHRDSKSTASDPSRSIDEINIPEVSNQKAEFVYNFYVSDERVNPFLDSKGLPLSKIPRYVALSWTSPSISDFEKSKETHTNQTTSGLRTIQANIDKVVSEDNFFNPLFVNHTFSNIDVIEQGASDLENYARLSRTGDESVFKMSKYQISEVASKSDSTDPAYQEQVGEVVDAYTTLADFPKGSLGLRVYDEKGKANDEDDLIRSISKSVSLTMKINSAVIPDVFRNSKEKTSPDSYKSLHTAHAESLKGRKNETQHVVPVYNDINQTYSSNLSHPVSLIGYVIERYQATPTGIKKEKEFYVENIQQTRFEDRTALYGVTYVYSIKVVASVKMLTYSSDKTRVDTSTIYVSSRAVSVPVECYEYSPPPEPNDIKFTFDYVRRNLVVHWDMPVNPQRDVKQFQVFRRKSIKEPFELIAQYGFDRSLAGKDQAGRYKTGERVDANNTANMLEEDRYLVHEQDPNATDKSYPVFMHVDKDFTVDTEFYVSSEYIYAVCSIDAHGMISNYSSQHHVFFDPYKNKLVTQVVCDAGSPRQYPNMMLRKDAFKDVISVEGDAARKLDIYFTPEYLKVRDDRNVKFKIVEAQTNNNNPYYLLQLINLDNQKMQLIKINIKDPQNLTT
jgi:hypothetical protein